jgi:hypothetical protein
MLLSLTGIAGAESEVRRQDHCTSTDRFSIWKGTTLVLHAYNTVFFLILLISLMAFRIDLPLLCVYYVF